MRAKSSVMKPEMGMVVARVTGIWSVAEAVIEAGRGSAVAGIRRLYLPVRSVVAV